MTSKTIELLRLLAEYDNTKDALLKISTVIFSTANELPQDESFAPLQEDCQTHRSA